VLFDEIDVAASPYAVIAVGSTLEPELLRAAYRNGVFPWPASFADEAEQDRELRRLVKARRVPVVGGGGRRGDGPLIPWVSPHPRAVVLTRQVHVPRSLARTLRQSGWTTTVDTAFDDVIAACADRESTWITPQMAAAYRALHADGDAHSVEVWSGDELVGGLYGVLSGRVFSGESMFMRATGASKAAVVSLCRRLAEVDVPLLDTQQESPHLRALGQVLVSREDYVGAVRALQTPQPPAIPTDRRAVI
jgi:leucyl/phenylalanyl-tRNA--protein transferase